MIGTGGAGEAAGDSWETVGSLRSTGVGGDVRTFSIGNLGGIIEALGGDTGNHRMPPGEFLDGACVLVGGDGCSVAGSLSNDANDEEPRGVNGGVNDGCDRS